MKAIRTALRCALPLVAITLLGSGCVRVYKTKDVRETLAQGQGQVASQLNNAEQTLKQAREALATLIAQQPDLDAVALAKLKSQLAALPPALEAIREQNAALQRLRGHFEDMVGGKRKIRSDQPEWERLEELRAEYERQLTKARDTVQAFGTAARRFQQSYNQAGKKPAR